jgi:hypothetical protein
MLRHVVEMHTLVVPQTKYLPLLREAQEEEALVVQQPVNLVVVPAAVG